MFRPVYFYVFTGFFLFYLSLSPMSVSQMGYQPENTDAAAYLAARLIGRSAPKLDMPRNGIVEPILATPLMFLALPLGEVGRDRVASLEPILFVSLAVLVVFLWTGQIAPSWAYPLTAIFALATTVWPYAYIGMESAQMFFVILAGYLGLRRVPSRTWKRSVAFALACGIAISLKSSGVALVPAMGYLAILYYRRQWKDGLLTTRSYVMRTLALATPAAILFPINTYCRSFHQNWNVRVFGGQDFLAGPVAAVLNAVSLFISLNKGLLVYCPVILFCLVALGAAFKINRRVALFACLVLSGQVAIASVMFFWADETWGPRYLQCAIAPLFIVLAIAKSNRSFAIKRELPLMVLSLCGLCVSLLGILFPYHTLHVVAIRSSPSTFEQFQSDLEWNPFRFNLNLAKQRLRPDRDIYWPPRKHWDASQPSFATGGVQPISLKPYTTPQPYLLNAWENGRNTADIVLWLFCLGAGIAGGSLLVAAGLRERAAGLSISRAQPEMLAHNVAD